MGMEMGSIRLSRLNRLMHHLLSHRNVTSRELINDIGYSSMRMLQRDISYLRNEYSVDISYDYSKQAYTCRGCGNFVLYFCLQRDEALLLLASLSIAGRLMPRKSSLGLEKLWDKLRVIMPDDIANVNEECMPDIRPLLSEKCSKKFQLIMNRIDNSLTLGRGGDCE